MKFLIVLAVLLTACTVSIDEDSKIDQTCVDTRDGETFTLIGSTIRNPQIDWVTNDACFTADTVEGETKIMCKSHEQFIKCEPGFYEKSE